LDWSILNSFLNGKVKVTLILLIKQVTNNLPHSPLKLTINYEFIFIRVFMMPPHRLMFSLKSRPENPTLELLLNYGHDFELKLRHALL
jgi:hypothetical protein